MEKQEVKSTTKVLFGFYLVVVLGLSYYFKNDIREVTPQTAYTSTVLKKVEQLTGQKMALGLSEGKKEQKYDKITLREFKGEVIIKRGSRTYNIKSDYIPKVRDIISTKRASFVSFLFAGAGENKVVIGPNSTIRFDSLFSNNKGDLKDSKIYLYKGKILNVLRNLMGTSYEISTRFCTLGVRGTEFMVRVEENGRTLVNVREGQIASTNIVNNSERQISGGEALIFTEEGKEIPITKEEVLEEFLKEGSYLQTFEVKDTKNRYEAILEKWDNFKLNYQIKNRIVNLKTYYENQVERDQKTLKIISDDVEYKISDFEKLEKDLKIDQECLITKPQCKLKTEALLLKEGLVRTSGNTRYNKASYQTLERILKKNVKVLEEEVKRIEDFKRKMAKNKEAFKELEALNDGYFPEDLNISQKVKSEVISFSKEIKDNDLTRFIEEAKW